MSIDDRLRRAKPRTRTRIDWSDDDRRDLADKVFELMQQAPDKNLIFLANEAQNRLPGWSGKTRKIAGMNQVAWLKREIKQRFQQQKHELFRLRQEKTPETPPPPPRIPTAKEILREASNAEIIEIVLSRLFGSLDEIKTNLARIETNMPQRSWKAASSQHQASTTPTPATPPSTNGRPLPAFAVVGLSTEQESKIKTEFRGLVKFKFSNGKASKINIPLFDRAFVMARWTSGPILKAYRSHSQRSRVIFIENGGMSQLIDRITAVLAT